MEEEDSFGTWQEKLLRAQQYRTPSASSGTIPSFGHAGPNALAAARNVSNLRQNKRRKPRGAPEPNVTCYRNSVLFTLLCTDSFMGFIRNHWEGPLGARISGLAHSDVERGSISKSPPFKLLSDLWDDYWNRHGKQEQLNQKMKDVWTALTALPNIGSEVGWYQQVRQTGGQQDAREFLQWMITYEKECASGLGEIFEDYTRLFNLPMTHWRLCKECRAKGKKEKRVRHPPEHNDILVFYVHEKATRPRSIEELLRDEFKYPSGTAWKCDTCRNSNESGQNNVNGAKTNGGSVDGTKNKQSKGTKDERAMEVKDEQAKGARNEQAEKTNEVLPAWKYVGHLPEVLFIYLSRATNAGEKSRHKIDIPENLTFEPKWLDPDKYSGDRELVSRKYKLTGVISHEGESLNSGHYKTNVLVDGQWYDINTEQCTESDFKKAVGNGNKFDPVILVWQRQSDGMREAEFKATQHIAPGLPASKRAQTSASATDGSPGRKRNVRRSASGSRSSSKAQTNPETPTPGKRSAGRQESARQSTPTPATSPSMDISEFYLRLKVALGKHSYLFHHRIEPPVDIVLDTFETEGPPVKIDVHLLCEESSAGTTFQLDLFGAATRPDNGFKLKEGDASIHPWFSHNVCDCEDVHEGACRNLKRKVSAIEAESSEVASPEKRRKTLPALFQRRGDDPYNYPSIEERYRIQESIDRAVGCQQKWKDWKPPAIERRAASVEYKMKSSSPVSVPAHQSPSPAAGSAHAATPHTPPNQAPGGTPQSDREISKTPHSLTAGERPTPTSVPKDKSSPFIGSHASRSPAEQRVANSQGASMVANLKNDMVSGRFPAAGPVTRTSETIQTGDGGLIVPSPANSEFKSPPKSVSGSSQRPPSVHTSSPFLHEGAVIQQEQDQPLNSGDEATAQANDSGVAQHPPPVHISAHAPRTAGNVPGDDSGSSSDSEMNIPHDPKPPHSSPKSRRGSHTSDNAAPHRRSSSASARSHHTASVRSRRSSATPAAVASSSIWADRIRQPFINYRNDFRHCHRDVPVSLRYVTRSFGWVKRQMRTYPKTTTAAMFVSLVLASGGRPIATRLSKRALALLARQMERLFGLAMRGSAQAVDLAKMAAKLGGQLARLAGGKLGEGAEWVKELVRRMAREVMRRGGRVKEAMIEKVEHIVLAFLTGLGDPEAAEKLAKLKNLTDIEKELIQAAQEKRREWELKMNAN